MKDKFGKQGGDKLFNLGEERRGRKRDIFLKKIKKNTGM